MTDANGNTVRYEYDEASGRLIRAYTSSLDTDRTSNSGDGKAITHARYTYDGFGRLQTVSARDRKTRRGDSTDTEFMGEC